MRFSRLFREAVVARERSDLVRAARLFEAAIEVNPRSALAQSQLGFLRIELEDLAGSEVAFRRAVSLDPNPRQALDGLGMVLTLRHAHEEAVNVLDDVTRTAPSATR